jgi:hypothetical protein
MVLGLMHIQKHIDHRYSIVLNSMVSRKIRIQILKNKTKNNFFYNVGRFLKSNRKIVERSKIDTSRNQKYIIKDII